MTLDRTTREPAYYDDRLEYATLAGSIQGDGGNLHVRDCGVAAVMLGEIPSWQAIGLVFRIQWSEGGEQVPVRLGIGLAGPHSRLPLPDAEVGEAGELTGLPGVRSLQFAVNIPFEFTETGTHHLCMYFDGEIAATIQFDVSSTTVPNMVTFDV